MNINEVPQGINVVVETDEVIYVGRFRNAKPGLVRLCNCAVHSVRPGENREAFVRSTAKFGIPVDQRDIELRAGEVRRVRALKDVPKD